MFQAITSVCDITHCVFAGDVAFYGMPPAEFPFARLRSVLGDGDFEVPPGRGALVFAHNQLTRLALGYLKRHGLLDHKARFDVVAVIWPDDARHPHIDHIQNAFEAVGRGQMFS